MTRKIHSNQTIDLQEPNTAADWPLYFQRAYAARGAGMDEHAASVANGTWTYREAVAEHIVASRLREARSQSFG